MEIPSVAKSGDTTSHITGWVLVPSLQQELMERKIALEPTLLWKQE